MNLQENRAKFLIIRFSSIGDIVLTTPVIRNLKNQVENAEVHFLTKKTFAPVLEANPFIDKLYLLDKDYHNLIKKLKTEGYDYIIDLHRNLRTSRVKMSLKRMNFTFDKLNVKKWLLVNLKKNLMSKVHIVDRYMDTIKLFIDEPDTKGLDYFVPEHVSMPEGLPENYVVMVIGANHYTKQLPDKKLIEMCDKLNHQAVLIGGKADVEKARNIENRSINKPVNLAGKLTINQSALVLKGAHWVVTPDTGMMHIAAAFGKRIISYWGNTVPEFGMTPYQPDLRSQLFEVEGLSCRPCSKIGFEKCPKGHFKCMAEQDINKMTDLVNSGG